MTDPCDDKFSKLEWVSLEMKKLFPNLSAEDCVTLAENLLTECQRREQPEASE